MSIVELLDNVYTKETAHKVENYPYGFKLKTTKYYWLEKNKNGFRLCEMTINPKTGKENKVAKTTYSDYMRFYLDENGHIKFYSYRHYNYEDYKKALDLNIFLEEDRHSIDFGIRKTLIIGGVYRGNSFEDIKDLSIEELNNLK